MADINLFDAAIAAVTGYGVVFLGLVLIMGAVQLLGKAMNKAEAAPAAAPAPAASAAPEAAKPLAPGSCGGCDCHDVPDRTVALLMAIVADQLQIPLNRLRFISIREIKEEA